MKIHKLHLLFIGAFFIRLISLNQSLWLDEAVTFKAITHFSYLDLIRYFSPTDFHPPFYYLFMKTWIFIFGTSEIALRMPSVLFSLLTGYVILQIGKVLKKESLGFWGAVLFLFNPLIMYYSQEARMYMMATFFVISAFYYYLRCLSEKKEIFKDIFLTNLFMFLSFFTFYGSIFFVSGIYGWLILQRRWRLFWWLHIGFWSAFIILSPLLLKQFLNSRETLHLVVNWSSVLGLPTFKNLFLIPLKFATGRISFNPKILFYAVTGTWTVIVAFFTIRGAIKNRLVAFMFLYPVALAFAFSFLSPLLQYFRFLYLIPFGSLLIAYGVYKEWQKYLLLIGFLFFSVLYLLVPAFHREDWKSAARSLNKANSVYLIYTFTDPVLYYRPDVHTSNLLALPDEIYSTKITVIPYGAEIFGTHYVSVLASKGFHLTATHNYRGLQTEDWEK